MELRPSKLCDVIGQSKIKERLSILIKASKITGEPMDHLLFDGPPGLGKTTFATVIPNELGVPVQMISGAAVKNRDDMFPIFANAINGSVIFIDEIHRLPKTVCEFLYTAMEDFRIDMMLGKHVLNHGLSIHLPRFTLIGATTRSSMLPAPLRDRFKIREHLDFYNVAELTELVIRNAQKMDFYLTEAGAREIAARSRGTPRIANNHLKWVRNWSISNGCAADSIAALNLAEINANGLTRQDLDYLRIVAGSQGPIGVHAIASIMNIALDTVSEEIEPYLLREGFVQRTGNGRVITTKERI